MAGLVYHNGALGDFLSILPALSYYRHASHETTITFFGRREFGLLAKHYRLVDNILNIDSAQYSFLFSDNLTDKHINFFNPFTSALFFIPADSQFLIHAQQQKHLNILHHNPFPSEEIHIHDYHLSLFYVKKNTAPFNLTLLPSATTQDAVSVLPEMQSPAVAIAPGSGSSLKNWPFSRFRTIASKLNQRGIHVCWVAGDAEQHYPFASDDHVIKNHDLIALSLFLRNCTCFIGNDSGITHLAALSGCPVIAIFGPSNPKIWSPKGLSVKILYKEICSPCHTVGQVKPQCNQACLMAITTEEVFEQVERYILP